MRLDCSTRGICGASSEGSVLGGPTRSVGRRRLAPRTREAGWLLGEDLQKLGRSPAELQGNNHRRPAAVGLISHPDCLRTNADPQLLLRQLLLERRGYARKSQGLRHSCYPPRPSRPLPMAASTQGRKCFRSRWVIFTGVRRWAGSWDL